MSHPWLGEGIPYAEVHGAASLPLPLAIASSANVDLPAHHAPRLGVKDAAIGLEASTVTATEPVKRLNDAIGEALIANPHRNLGLLLSRQIAEMHSGQITIQSTPESGYRYVISLPQKAETTRKR